MPADKPLPVETLVSALPCDMPLEPRHARTVQAAHVQLEPCGCELECAKACGAYIRRGFFCAMEVPPLGRPSDPTDEPRTSRGAGDCPEFAGEGADCPECDGSGKAK